MEERCSKKIYYQTTQVIHWNLLRITTANAIMWCDIFHLVVGRNKKRKTAMEGNWRLTISIEDHITDLYCLFRCFKKIWHFLLTTISLYKNIFFISRCWTEIKLILSWKRCWFRWFHDPFFLVKFLWCHYCRFHTQRPGNYSICLSEQKIFSYHICYENMVKYSSDRHSKK